MANIKALGHRLIWTIAGAWPPDDDSRHTRDSLTAEAIRRVALSEYERRMIRPSSQLARDARRGRSHGGGVDPQPLNDADIQRVGTALGEQADALGYVLLALAVLPDHVQLVMRHHRDRPEDSIEQLKHAARTKLHARGDSWRGHPVWAGGGWSIPLERREQILAAVQAVRAEASEAEQAWAFLEDPSR